MNSKRLPYLDSIRGIAAFIVVLSHCYLFFQEHDKIYYLADSWHSLHDLLFCFMQKIKEMGRSSVIMFFVLSGFVLAYSLKQKTAYSQYIIKRLFRIYPAFLFAIIANYIAHYFIGVPKEFPANPIWNILSNIDFSIPLLIKSMLFWGTKETNHIDGVTWSLVHEMRISFIFPLIFLSVQRYGWKSLVLYFFTSIACAVCFYCKAGRILTGYHDPYFKITFLSTAYFIVFFAAGAYAAIHSEVIKNKVLGLPKIYKILLFTLSICLFAKGYNDNMLFNGAYVDFVQGVGALGIIPFAIGWPALSDLMSRGIPVWLGRISYSLYLVHMPISYMILQTAGQNWNPLQLSVAVIITSLAIAELVAITIEIPMIKIGRKLTRARTAQ